MIISNDPRKDESEETNYIEKFNYLMLTLDLKDNKRSLIEKLKLLT